MEPQHLAIVRFRTTKGYLLQVCYPSGHRKHPHVVVKDIHGLNHVVWAAFCAEHNALIGNVEAQDALLRATGLTDQKAS